MERATNGLNRIQGFHLYEWGEADAELRCDLTRAHFGPHVTKIPGGAFSGCDRLIELQLNEGLKVVGGRAFEGCTSLRSFTLPSSVTKLCHDAFATCSSLVELQLNEGLQVIGELAFQKCAALRSVTVPSTVTEIIRAAFIGCVSLSAVQLNEGLQTIGACAFADCTALRSLTIPSTVTKLGHGAFGGCFTLVEVQLSEGLEVIDKKTFAYCQAIRRVTIPSTVTNLGTLAFNHCSNLSEVVLLGGERLLDQALITRGVIREGQGILNQGTLDEILFDENRKFAFRDCPLTTVKISTSWVVSERMARLLPECRVAVEERIGYLRRLELMQDGDILACFPVVHQAGDTFEVDDDLETARSLYQVLQWIAFYELKESSVLLELAMWKSRIGGDRARADCRVSIPDPAKSLIMECCGFAGFLKPAIEGE